MSKKAADTPAQRQVTKKQRVADTLKQALKGSKALFLIPDMNWWVSGDRREELVQSLDAWLQVPINIHLPDVPGDDGTTDATTPLTRCDDVLMPMEVFQWLLSK